MKARIILCALLLIGLAVFTRAQQQSGTAADSVSNSAIVFPTVNGSLGDGTARADSTQRLFASANYYFNGTSWDRVRGDTSGIYAQGPGAAGAAVAGNPVRVGVSDGTNTRNLRGDASGFLDPAASSTALADALSNTANLPSAGGAAQTLRIVPFLFNGATWDRQATCAGTAPTTINPATATTTLLLAAVSAQKNRICMLEISDVGGATANTVKLIAGTQTTNPCDTGAVTLSPTYQFVANATQLNLTIGNGLSPFMQNTANNQQVCVVTSAAVSVFITARSVTY